jgi:hypothetical protein
LHASSSRTPLDSSNVSRKFSRKAGHLSVVDYRGFNVLSSFATIRRNGVKWLLLVKANESELYTRYWLSDPHAFRQRLQRVCRWHNPRFAQAAADTAGRHIVSVALDEFRRVDTSALLFTSGVSTCTALQIGVAGRFSYMAHISAFDSIYGGSTTNITRQIVRRIFDCELLRFDRQYLRVVIASPQTRSVERLVGILMQQGITLNQIRMVHRPQMQYCNLLHDTRSAETIVSWKDKAGSALLGENCADYPTIQQLMQRAEKTTL